MVNNGLQVFAVGIIQADNTVTGGTGWGVELGKFLTVTSMFMTKSGALVYVAA